MKTRIITAAVLTPLLLLFLIALPTICTVLLFGVICAVAAYELLVGTGFVKQIRLVIYAGIISFSTALWSCLGMNFYWALGAVLLFGIALFTELLVSKCKLSLKSLALTFLAGTLLPLLLCSMVRLFCQPNGRIFVFIPFVIAFLSDTGAYFVGSFLGKHKLAPEISPNKSVEGAVGGIVSAMVSMVVFCLIIQFGFSLKVNYGFALIYGLLGSVAGIFGDLCFSAIKRQSGIKDFSNLMPGHGGVLDRFDSVIFVAPFVELLMILIPLAV